MISFFKLAAIGVAMSLSSLCAQAALVNGNFGTGDLSGWTAFTTTNGTLGTGYPTTSTFDVNGQGSSSSALGLSVGYVTPPCSFPGLDCPRPNEGGGIRQVIALSGGTISVRADVAVSENAFILGSNLDGGTFSVFLDGMLLDSYSVGFIENGAVQRGLLEFSADVSAGLHTLEFLVTRQYSYADSLTQYIDNISLIEVSEPSAFVLFGTALFPLFMLSNRRRKSHKFG